MGFPLLLNKALTWSHELWIWTFYKLHSFETGLSHWASGLSLAVEQSISRSQKAMNRGQETWIWAFNKLHSFEEGVFRVGKWAFPCC